MATIALASGVKKFLERHLSRGDHSPVEIAIAAALGILIAAIAKYPDRAMFVRARPELKDKSIPGYPLVGNLPHGLKKEGSTLRGLKNTFDKYGDVFAITVPVRGRMIAINNPELLQHVLKTNFYNYIKGEDYLNDVKDLLGNGIFTKDGDEWRFHRKTTVAVFTTKMYRNATETGFTSGARDLCAVFDKYEKLGQPMNLQVMFLKQTLDVFGKLTFGIDLNALKTDQFNEFEDAFDFLMTNVDTRLNNPFWEWTDHLVPGKVQRLKNAMASLDKYAYIAIERRKNEPAEDKEKRPSDFLDHFVNHMDEHGNKLTDLQLRDIIVDFMLAGRDTTGYTLTWQFYCLLANPRVLKNVMKELEIVLQGSEKYTYETIMHELPYLKAVFYETLRLHPPVPRNLRLAAEDDVLPDGTVVYKGEKIIYSSWTMSRNRSVWGEDAEVFVPERWLADEDEILPTTHSVASAAVSASGHGVSPFGKFKMENLFKFNSFGSSPRLCLGQTFATLQAMVTTCMLLQNFDMTLAPGQPIPEPKPSGALPMIHPLLAYAKRKPGRDPLSTSYIKV
ncbi:hypothetical protein BGX27_002594 [Mortierella sp. AM989]|nr:hypothetical protein BGX27_002594 [Mortierella sp. AM989]